MPSSSRKRFHKTLGFRLTFWYSSIFIISSLTLSIVSFAFVFSTMRDNRKAIQSQLAEYRSVAEASGIQAIEKTISQQRNPSRRTTFFVRVIAPGNKTVLLSNPQLWEEFEFMGFDYQQAEGRWQYFTSRRDTGLLEVTSVRLSNDQVLQVGKSIQDREDILERFRDTLLATMIPMIMIGLGGGAFLAYRVCGRFVLLSIPRSRSSRPDGWTSGFPKATIRTSWTNWFDYSTACWRESKD